MAKRNQAVTSLRIDPDLLKQAKILAINRNTTLATLVEKALRNEISNIPDSGAAINESELPKS